MVKQIVSIIKKIKTLSLKEELRLIVVLKGLDKKAQIDLFDKLKVIQNKYTENQYYVFSQYLKKALKTVEKQDDLRELDSILNSIDEASI